MNEDLTIIVNSCDKYEDLWYPFFELFRIQWPDCPYKIILNTESKSYTHPNQVGGGITCLQLYKENEQVDWSTRLIETLKYVDTEYVLMFLDDEFIVDKVNEERFNKSYNILKSDNKIVYIIYLNMYSSGELKTSCKYEELLVIKRLHYCQHSANCSLWRKNALKYLLKAGESPDKFEIYSKRRRKLFDRVYMFKGEVSPIQLKIRINFGYGVFKGKWLFNNKALFEKYGIKADFSKRGVWSEEEINEMMRSYRERVKQQSLLSRREKFKIKIDEYKEAMPENLRGFLSKVKRVFKRKK